MGAHILVIEDDKGIADFVTRGLREGGFIVEHAADGISGWDYLRCSEWDLVILDWWLPGTDGLELLKRFRQTDRTTPVLFLTAKDAISDRVTGLDNGANDYLCKPFAFAELVARVRVLLRSPIQSSSSVISYKDLTVDLVTQRVERAGQRLELTSKEQSLLIYFLRHPEQVLSRTLIYEQVWEERYDGLSNTLEVHMMELRRKLESCGPRLIHTLRNRGYRLGEGTA